MGHVRFSGQPTEAFVGPVRARDELMSLRRLPALLAPGIPVCRHAGE